MGLPRGDARVRNWVNSGKPKRAACAARMAILSQAAEGRWSVRKGAHATMGSAEGAETSGVSPNDNPRRRAPGTPTATQRARWTR